MPTPTIFEAIDPAGGLHYRTSERRHYTHAILTRTPGTPWNLRGCAGRPDLAHKAVEQERRNYEKWAQHNEAADDSTKAAALRAREFIVVPVTVVERRPKASAASIAAAKANGGGA